MRQADAIYPIQLKLLGSGNSANSPQAKAGLSVPIRTLQDRLVKELRLRNISDIKTANLWLSEFVKDYNSRRFDPRENGSAHRGDSSFSGRT